MASRFHALFGICRRKGGTKKSCYSKAVAGVSSPRRKRAKKGKKTSRKGKRTCRTMGYSKAAGHKVCREYKAC